MARNPYSILRRSHSTKAVLVLRSKKKKQVKDSRVPVMFSSMSFDFGFPPTSWRIIIDEQTRNQVAKATAVCDEALSNIRTVRAFAMEEQEERLYGQQVGQAARLNERLGFGIALFQVVCWVRLKC